MPKLTSLPIFILCAAVAGLTLYIFYFAPLPNPSFSKQPQRPIRYYIEEKLYDICTRLKPDIEDFNQVIVAGIDQFTIHALEGERSSDLSFENLLEIVGFLDKQEIKSLSVFLYPNIYPYDHPKIDELVKIVQANPKIRLAVMGIDTQYPSPRKLPDQLQGLQNQTFGVETYRQRRFEKIRRLPYVAYRGRERRALLLSDLAGIDVNGKTTHDAFLLNYSYPGYVPQINAADFHPQTQRGSSTQAIRGKHVLLGYTVYRERPINNEQIFANTPWQTDNIEPSSGVPLVVIQAIGLNNLLHKSWLEPVSDWVNVLQTVIIAGCSAAIWYSGIGIGVILLVGWWIFLFYGHGLLLALFNIYLPLSDALIFSWMVTIAGALITFRHESLQRLYQEAKTEALSEVEKLQSRFLSKFEEDLSQINTRVISLFSQHKIENLRNEISQKLFLKLLNSSEELRDYLYGIRNFAAITTHRKKSLNITSVPLESLINKIVNQFEAKIADAGLQVEINCLKNLRIKTDITILEPIVFNLISNAVKYSPRGATVKIDVALTPPNLVTIAVKDQGPGIDPEYHRSIFEKFYRVKDDLVYKIKGNGLGLYLCKYFADRINANIDLESSPGKGSTFFLKLKTSI